MTKTKFVDTKDLPADILKFLESKLPADDYAYILDGGAAPFGWTKNRRGVWLGVAGWAGEWEIEVFIGSRRKGPSYVTQRLYETE